MDILKRLSKAQDFVTSQCCREIVTLAKIALRMVISPTMTVKMR